MRKRRILLSSVAAIGLTLALAPSATAQIVDPTDLHLGATGATGSDPVLLNGSTAVNVSDVPSGQAKDAFNLEIILAVPQFGTTPVTAPTLGTLSTSMPGVTATAGTEVNFTLTSKSGADLFSTSDTTDKDLYGYVGCAPCDNSLNKGNFEGSAFTSLFTMTQLSTLTGFDVFEIPISFSNAGSDLLAQQTLFTTGDNLGLGTYVAALAFESDGVTPLATSFTNTGLVNKLGAPPPPPSVPEPTSLVLLGTGLLAMGGILRRRFRNTTLRTLHTAA